MPHVTVSRSNKRKKSLQGPRGSRTASPMRKVSPPEGSDDEDGSGKQKRVRWESEVKEDVSSNINNGVEGSPGSEVCM